MYDHILIRYGELALKGKNQKQFLKTLMHNIRRQIKVDLQEEIELERLQGRIVLKLDNHPPERYYPSLDRVFGLSSYSPVIAADLQPQEICRLAVLEMKNHFTAGKRFRVTVKRANKQFPVRSMDFQKDVAEAVLEEIPDLQANLTDYDIELSVDIRFDRAFIYSMRRPGLGGLPLGTGGRGMLLLSGGIDSPVAGWLMMRRGVVMEAIHFHSYPYTSKLAEQKVLDLAQALTRYSGHFTVHLVPFTAIQEAIGANCHENLRITIMRRIMLRIAERLTLLRHGSALVTGDNIGQVASQTIESLQAINQVTTMPVLRPLLTYDKLDIMEMAKKIDTYDISVLPYEDCCTVFVPKEPKTKPKTAECEREERRLPELEMLIEQAMLQTESVTVYADSTRASRRQPFQKSGQTEESKDGQKSL